MWITGKRTQRCSVTAMMLTNGSLEIHMTKSSRPSDHGLIGENSSWPLFEGLTREGSTQQSEGRKLRIRAERERKSAVRKIHIADRTSGYNLVKACGNVQRRGV